MSIKNSTLHKLARREYKKMRPPFEGKQSKWIMAYNKYGLPEYQMLMIPTAMKGLK